MKNLKTIFLSVAAGLGLSATTVTAAPVQILYNGSVPAAPFCLGSDTTWWGFSLGNTAGKSNFTWSVRGDLAIAGSPSGTATGTSCSTIGSFNKNPSFNTQPFGNNAFNGVGKGRIVVSYIDSTIGTQCGLQTVYLDVYKGFCPIGWPIVGPLCASIGDTVTYSIHSSVSVNVGDLIGIDRYYWSWPAGMQVIYYSGDSSSITLKVNAGYSGGNMTVKMGQCNNCTETLTLGLNAPAPTITPAGPLCIPVGTTSQAFTASAPATGVSYSWSVGGNNTWGISSSGAGNVNATLSIPSSDPNPGYVVLTSTGSCNVRRDTIRVNRPVSGAIAAPNGTCITIGSSYTFSVNTAQSVNWTLPSAGWTVSPNLNSPIITLTAGAGASSGNLTVASNCGASLSLPLRIKPGNAGAITASTSCLAPGSTTPVNLSIPAVSPAASSYQWTVTPAAAGTISPSGNTAVFIPSASNTLPVTITVTPLGISGCNGNASSTVINYSPSAPVFVTTPSCINYNLAQTLTYAVTSVAGVSYSWSVSPGSVVNGSVPSGSASTTFTIHPTTSSFTVTCTASNACGSAGTPVVANVSTGASVITSFNPGAGNPDVYILSNPPAGATFQWYVNDNPVSNSATVTGATGQVLSLFGNGTPPTSVCVYITSGSCTARVCAPTTGTHSTRMAPNRNELSEGVVTVYPNPNKGTFSLSVPEFGESARVQMVDPSGKEIMSRSLKAGVNTLSELGLAAGNYILLVTVDGKMTVKRVTITR